MDAPHTWWNPLVEQFATAVGSGFFGALTAVFAGWVKKGSTRKELDQVRADIKNIQEVQTLYAQNMSELRTARRDDLEQLNRFNREIGRLEGNQKRER